MDIDALLSRIRRVRHPDAPPDPGLLAAVTATVRRDGAAAARLVEAGRLLDGVPADRIAPAGQRPRPLRVALAGTFTAPDVAPLLRLHLLAAGIEPVLHVAGFDQLGTELTDPGSELARFGADVTACQLDERAFLPDGWDPTALDELRAVLADRLDLLARAVTGYAGRAGAPVVLHTVALPPVEARTVIGYRERATLGRLWRELNTGLLELAGRDPVHVLDLELMLADHPARLRDDRLAAYAGMAWSPSVQARYARELAGFCAAAAGRTRKLLVLDLDNTLWGGVVGDDGPAGIALGGGYPGNCYAAFQRRVRALRRQGVLLAIASKNDGSTVDDVLAGHPDMVLRPGDFVARAVNWDAKDGNIRDLVAGLNLGLDSVVFVDDSAFECDLVRTRLPEVSVLRLAGDPAASADLLLSAGHFDTLTVTAADRGRTELYRARRARQVTADSAATTEDYLRGLGLRVAVRPVDDFGTARLAQLRLRTNQFNMTGRPQPVAPDGEPLALTVEVTDRFGAEGVVGGVWLDRRADGWHVENFVLSCRVLARGVEHAVLHEVCRRAGAAGAAALTAEFRATGRNGPAAGFYPATGFREVPGDDGVVRYHLPLDPPPDLRPDWIVLTEEGTLSHAGT